MLLLASDWGPEPAQVAAWQGKQWAVACDTRVAVVCRMGMCYELDC